MILTLLHTSEAHRAGFEALKGEVAPGATFKHIVRPDWLARAQDGVEAGVQDEIAEAVRGAAGMVLCTCATLGPVVESMGVMRIDAPMMRAAAQIAAKAEGEILLAYCLDSALVPSAALLDRALEDAGHKAKVHAFPLAEFRPLFDAGLIQPFHAVIASAIRENIESVPDVACIVLAQASMAGAAPLLEGLSVPVLTSPALALREALNMVN